MRRSAAQARILLLTFLAVAIMPAFPGGPFLRHAAAQIVSDNPNVRDMTSERDIRRLQRLLKLLSAGNPNRFASVDPGVIDGTLGPSTITAIRNFQRAIGVRESPAVTQALFAQILTAQAEPPAPLPITPPAKKPGAKTDAGRVTRQARFAQLVSLKDKARIDQEWTRLTRIHPALLKGREPVIETANLDQRGTYYRILVGPFNGFQAANSFCAELKKVGQSCLIKKRKIAKTGTGIEPDAAKSAIAIPGNQSSSPPASVPAPVSPPAPAIAAQPEPSPAATSEPKEVTADITPTENSRPAPPASEAEARTVGTPAEPASPREEPASQTTPSLTENTPDTLSAVTPPLSESDPKASGPADDKQAAEAAAVVDKAVTAEKTSSRAATPAKAVVQWLARVNQNLFQPYLAPGMAAVAGTIFGLLILIWWQRRRKSMMFEAIQIDPWSDTQEFEFEHHDGEPAPEDILEDLRVQFESAELAECREIRDSFLHGLAKAETGEEPAVAATEKSMMVNRRLNQMIATDPATYKSIFLNWIFLNHAAAALERSGYTLKRLDPRIQREFHLLGSFFKIHLLELEARHHVRDRLPNVFATLHQHES